MEKLIEKLSEVQNQLNTVTEIAMHPLVKQASKNTLQQKKDKLNRQIWDEEDMTGYVYQSEDATYLCLGKLEYEVVFLHSKTKEVVVVKQKDIEFSETKGVFRTKDKTYRTNYRYFESLNTLKPEFIHDFCQRRHKVCALTEDVTLLKSRVTLDNINDLFEDYEEKMAEMGLLNEMCDSYTQMVCEELSRYDMEKSATPLA